MPTFASGQPWRSSAELVSEGNQRLAHPNGKRLASAFGGAVLLMQSPEPALRSSATRDVTLVALAAAILFFSALGERDLWNPNEPIYGRAVVEMRDRGEWATPTVNGQPFAEKPILYFWLARIASEAFGRVDELTLRIPSALAGVATAVLAYLLVLPYAGRRRALMTAALLVTMFQVFWTARSVQMDVFVLASTLGVLVALTRMLDFGAPPARSWMLAGLAAGLGFTAKGPVALIVPGIVVIAYAVSTRRLGRLLHPALLAGALVTFAIAAPWYLWLWFQGERGFLYEVLVRQNFGRFLSAWDHERPWWYYLGYLWTDFAPWSWLLPAAVLVRGGDETEKKLRRLAWISIAGILAFFSLSESKRSPYVLAMAPAIALLAAEVLDRLASGALERLPRRLALGAMVSFASLASIVPWIALGRGGPDISGLTGPIIGLGAILAIMNYGVVCGVVAHRRRPWLASASLFAGVLAAWLTAALWALPAANSRKSAREFAAAIDQRLDRGPGRVASFGLWQWRAEYAFYADRTIPNLETPEELASFWRSGPNPLVVVEGKGDAGRVLTLVPHSVILDRDRIGSRDAYLIGKAPALAGPAVPIADRKSSGGG